MRVVLLSWEEEDPGVGDCSSFSFLSRGSSGMDRGRSSERGPLTEPFLAPPGAPAPPSSSEEMAKRGISMMAEQQRRRTVRGGLESLSVWDDSDTERRLRRLRAHTHTHRERTKIGYLLCLWKKCFL